MYCLPPCYEESGDETDDDFNYDDFKWEQKAESQYQVNERRHEQKHCYKSVDPAFEKNTDRGYKKELKKLYPYFFLKVLW